MTPYKTSHVAVLSRVWLSWVGLGAEEMLLLGPRDEPQESLSAFPACSGAEVLLWEWGCLDRCPTNALSLRGHVESPRFAKQGTWVQGPALN